MKIVATPSDIWTSGKTKSSAVKIISTQSKDQQVQLLEQGKSIAIELAGGQSNSYRISLAADQYARVVVNQRGIDVVIRLFGPAEKEPLEIDTEKRLEGEENTSWVAETAGDYRLDVVASEKNAAVGRYEISLSEVRAAEEKDRTLHETNKLGKQLTRLLRSGKYDQAIPLVERRIEIYERVLGAEDRQVARNINTLAQIYFRLNDYTKSESLQLRAMKIQEKLRDKGEFDLAVSKANLGLIYYEVGLYLKAEPFLQRALEIYQKELGSDHRYVASALHNLAFLYYRRADYDQAELLWQRAIAITERAVGRENNYIAQILNSIGIIYYSKFDYAKAESYFQEALSIREKVLGPDHPDLANSLSNLAHIYREREDYAKAESLYNRALTIWEKTIGSENHLAAQSLYHLATLYHKRGDYAKAEPLYLRSLAIREKLLTADHFDIAESLSGLAELYAAKGEIPKAVSLLSRANSICDRNIKTYLTKGSEREKLAYLSLFVDETNLTLSLQSMTSSDDPQALKLALTTLLRRKGVVLDTMTDTVNTLRRRASPEDQILFDQLAEALSQYATLSLRDSGVVDSANNQKNVKLAKDKVEKIQGELGKRISEFAETPPATIEAVQNILPASSALVEFALYQPQEPQNKKSKPERYVAYILTQKGDPKWVDLGEAATIDRAVDAWRNALRDPYRKDVRRLGREMDEKVMRPVRLLLSDTQHLLIAPDGKLSLIPFAALVDEDNQYLVKSYTISYLTSGRDLLRLQSEQPSRNAPLIVGNPVFGRPATIAMRTEKGSSTSAGRKQAAERIDQTKIFFQPLPGTEEEALAIKAVLPEAQLLLREQSTEAAIKEVNGPRILHIATHGFFFNDQNSQPDEMRAISADNPKENDLKTITAVVPARKIRYAVQLQATPDLETAQEKVKGFRSQKVDAYIVRAKSKRSGMVYRVRVGNFSGFTEAQKYLEELLKLGFGSDFFIASYRPPMVESAESRSVVVGLPLESANFAPGSSVAKNRRDRKVPLQDLRLSKFAARVDDPLLRSGLALAGANQGKSGDRDDGLLTAMEASGLDLLGTKLVVLSACDTGVGDLKTGEGVQGLRRALVQAGSESQVISLWPVPDQSTKDLMVPFYNALQKGEGRSEGLRQVQLRMLEKKEHQHPFYWAAFIQSGDWANLEGKR